MILANPDLVVFGASWCNPCSMLKKHLEISGIKYKLVDVDSEEMDDWIDYKIRSVPTTLILNADNDTVKARLQGFPGASQFNTWLEANQ